MSYVKSPLNYIGGKYKLLPQIIPLFPSKINTFVDLFGGGFNVGVNIDANNVIYNEKDFHVVELLKYLKGINIDSLLKEADSIIYRFNLSKENQDGYNNLRDYYNNQNSSPMVFYTLLCYAFNNQIRFNQDGKYNMPFGRNRSSFNPTLRKRFILFVEALQRLKCDFTNLDFRCFPFQTLTDSDFVYCDPPYYNSTATYNEQNGWNEKDEIDLLNVLDNLNEKGVKFALSNNLKYENPILDSWKDKYNLQILNINYNNCNYHKNNKQKDKEILITNY